MAIGANFSKPCEGTRASSLRAAQPGWLCSVPIPPGKELARVAGAALCIGHEDAVHFAILCTACRVLEACCLGLGCGEGNREGNASADASTYASADADADASTDADACAEDSGGHFGINSRSRRPRRCGGAGEARRDVRGRHRWRGEGRCDSNRVAAESCCAG